MGKKLCTECKNLGEDNGLFGRSEKICVRKDPKTGEPVFFGSLNIQRQGNFIQCRLAGLCGKGGRFFEKKEE